MNLSTLLAPRLAVAVLASAGLVACEGSTDFTHTETIVVNKTSTSYDGTTLVDLSTTGKAWDNRSHIKGLTVSSLTGTIISTETGNAATTGSGTLVLVADAAEGGGQVQVGTITAAAIAAGTTYAVPDPGAAGDLIYRALKGSGKFSAVVSGAANAQPVRFTVDLTIVAHVKYSLM